MNATILRKARRHPKSWLGWVGILFFAGAAASYGIGTGDVVDIIQTRQDRVYHNCRIFKVDPDGLMFSHEAGAAKILYADMKEETLHRVGYDPSANHTVLRRITTPATGQLVLTGGDDSAVTPAPVPPQPMWDANAGPGPWLPQATDAPVDYSGVPFLPVWDPSLGLDEARRRGYFGHYGNRRGVDKARVGREQGQYNYGAHAVSPVTRYPFWAVSPLFPANLATPSAACRVVPRRPAVSRTVVRGH